MQKNPRRVFISGPGGYIGSALVLAFLRRGWEVVGFGRPTRFDALARACASPNVRLIDGDIIDEAQVRAAMRGADVVVHAAGPAGEKACARDPHDALRSIVRGTRVIAEATRFLGVSSVIHLSTQAVYSTYRERPMPLRETDECTPDDWYGALKAEAEQELRNTPAAILRLTNVYGRGAGIVEKTDAVGRFIQASKHDEPLTVFGDGSQGVDFIHIDDVSDIVCGFAEQDRLQAGVYNVGSEHLTSLRELAEIVSSAAKEKLGTTSEIRYQEAPPGKVWPNRWVSNAKVKALFPLFPRKALVEGVHELL